MRAPVKWLKDYVQFEESPEVLGDRLTMAGIPVEGIERPCQELKNIVTGKIRSVDPHPNADRLSVCILDLGDRLVKIVTAEPMSDLGKSCRSHWPAPCWPAEKSFNRPIFVALLRKGCSVRRKKSWAIRRSLLRRNGKEFTFCRTKRH